jgi:hypothetical protein
MRGTVIGFEWVNLAENRIDLADIPVRSVSAEVMFRDKVLAAEAAESAWHNLSIYVKSNFFPFTDVTDNANAQQEMDMGGCQDRKFPVDAATKNPKEPKNYVRGSIFAGELRLTSPLVAVAQHDSCDADDPTDPAPGCAYEFLQRFVPLTDFQVACQRREVWDILWPRATNKHLLMDSAKYADLMKFAKDRWDRTRRGQIDDARFAELTTGLPKVCSRWVNNEQKSMPKAAVTWKTEGVLVAVWCDRK